MPREIELGRLIDRFGAQAVMGRALGAKEIKRIMAAEYIVKAYESMTKAENYAAWVSEHPREAGALGEAAGMVRDE